MSVEEFDQFGPDGFPKSHIAHMQPLPDATEWPGDREASRRPGREVPIRIPPLPRLRLGKSRWIWQVLLAVFLAFVIGAGGTLYYLDQTFAGLIYPNISIRGLPVGQMTGEEASTLLHEHYADFLQQPLTIMYDDHTWTPSLAELGVRVEIDEAVERALATGRKQGFIDNLRYVATIWEHGLDLPLRVTIDQAAMQGYILARAAQIDQPAQEARLIFQGTQVGTQPARPGYQTLVNDTIQDIIAAVQTLEPQTVILRTRELPPLLDNAAVAEARATVEKMLQGPITLKTSDQEWEWSERDLASMIRVDRVAKPDGTGDRLEVTLDRAWIQRRLRTIAEETDRPSEHPRVHWNGGNLEIFREGEPGRQLDLARAEQNIVTAATGPNRTINLPFKMDESAITEDNIDQISIPDLLAVGRSDFTGSAAYRITNIKAGMNLLHGILLAPGEEFSFNENIGSIDAANGFVEGYAIIQNRTQLEWGGGICQDSTTMFRAAFWAGLPITERHGHSFYISWYDKYGYGEYGNGPGMDATIYTGPGGPDLKFVNDTGNWLLIQTYVDTARTLAEVRIYGTETGRTVALEGPTIVDRTPPPSAPVYVANPSRPRGAPRQTDTARGGMTVTFTRIIKENGVEVDRETFVTWFKPWPNIFEVHPADLDADGRYRPWQPEEEEQEEQETPPEEGTGTTPPEQVEAPPPPAEEPVPITPPGDVVPITPPGDVAPVVP